MQPVAIINPMKSRNPTGIGFAADAIAGLLGPEVACSNARLDGWFMALNDSRLPGAVRIVARLGLAQIAPLFFPRRMRLVFATHHAPLWRTGRHAVVVYDSIPLQFPGQAPAQTGYYRRCLPRVVRCAERVVVISEAVRNEYLVLGYFGTGKAVVVPACSPRAGRKPVSDVEVKREPRLLLVVGARYPHKNIDVVLSALERLNQRATQPWRLVLAGVDRRLWGSAWGGLGHFERLGWVTVVDRVSDEELDRLYATATILVYPSLAEGQGMPPLEAMDMGCQVVCSDLPVLRETCGDAARYFPAGDVTALARCIEETVSDQTPDEKQKRDAECRVRLREYGREALASRWREFLGAWL